MNIPMLVLTAVSSITLPVSSRPPVKFDIVSPLPPRSQYIDFTLDKECISGKVKFFNCDISDPSTPKCKSVSILMLKDSLNKECAEIKIVK